jgi:hypothetical protein
MKRPLPRGNKMETQHQEKRFPPRQQKNAAMPPFKRFKKGHRSAASFTWFSDELFNSGGVNDFIPMETKGKSLCCQVCDLSMKTVEELQEHLVGPNHNEELAKRGLKDNIGNAINDEMAEGTKDTASEKKNIQCKVCNQFCPYDSLGLHIMTETHKIAEAVWKNSRKSLPSFKDMFYEFKPVGSDENTTKISELHCDVCKVTCETPNSFKSHLEGKKHEKNATKKRNAENNIFRCEVCDVTVGNKSVLNIHLQGQRHAQNVSNQRKQKSQQQQQQNQQAMQQQQQTMQQQQNHQSMQQQQSHQSMQQQQSHQSMQQQQSHQSMQQQQQTIKLYNCEVCNLHFNNNHELALHYSRPEHSIKIRAQAEKLSANNSMLFKGPTRTPINLATNVIMQHKNISTPSATYANIQTSRSTVSVSATNVSSAYNPYQHYYMQAQNSWTQFPNQNHPVRSSLAAQTQSSWAPPPSTLAAPWVRPTTLAAQAQSLWTPPSTLAAQTQPPWAPPSTLVAHTQPSWAPPSTLAAQTQPSWAPPSTLAAQTQPPWAPPSTLLRAAQTQPSWAPPSTLATQTQPPWAPPSTLAAQTQPPWAPPSSAH